MNYPLISEYIEAIKLAENNLDLLSHLRPELDDDGNPVMSSGNFAVVFKMKNKHDGKYYALKCFIKEQESRKEGYRLIFNEQNSETENFIVPSHYYENELFVNSKITENKEFPVVVSSWIIGETLDSYILANYKNKKILQDISFKFNKLALWIIKSSTSDGKLRLNNFLVQPNGTLVLNDIDSMLEHLMVDSDNSFRPIMVVSKILNLIAAKPNLLTQFTAEDPHFFSDNDFNDITYNSITHNILGTTDEFISHFELDSISDVKVLEYLSLARQGDDESQFMLGQCYFNGYGIKKDLKEAVAWYQKSAEKGYSRAQEELGVCLFNGFGIKVDKHKAFKWFLRAAKQGLASAQNNLGNCYFYGQGVKSDKLEAFKWYSEAADQKNAESQFHLGLLFYYGLDISQNKDKGITWIKRAAFNGNVDAQVMLVMFDLYDIDKEYLYGYSTAFLCEIAAKESVIAQYHWYDYFYPEKNKFLVCDDYDEYYEPNYRGMAMGFLKVAEKGHIFAQLKMAQLYNYGSGVIRDKDEAEKWLDKVQKQGYANQIGLSRIDQYIKQNVKDYEYAILLRGFAEKGLMEAQLVFGNYYEHGRGVPQNDKEAGKWYLTAAKQGCIEAQLIIGDWYWSGHYYKQSFTKSVEWYLKAAMKGSTKAQFIMGYCYDVGIGVSQDKRLAQKWYHMALKRPDFLSVCSSKIYSQDNHSLYHYLMKKRQLAEEGDVESQNWLGYFYKNINGVLHDHNEAIRWYRKAAESGYAESQYQLGLCYIQDASDDINVYEVALDWFRKAARHGHTGAMNQIGECYICGYGVNKNKGRALHWYTKSAEQGNPEAHDRLGDYYQNGGEWEYNYWHSNDYLKESIMWYQRAAKQGHAFAQYKIALLYQNKQEILNVNDDEIMKCLFKAAEQGCIEAQCRLGECYLFGWNTKENILQARKWFRKAADQGDREADEYLRKGINQHLNNKPESIKEENPPADNESIWWYIDAAKRGNADAQFHLAECYRHGYVPGRDASRYSTIDNEHKEALKWYRKAAEQGHCEAQLQLGLFLDNSISDDYYYESERKDDKRNYEAFTWITIAAKQGHADAQFYMGKYYEYGIIVKQSDQLAIEWYRNAAKRGSANAQYKLADCYRNGKYVPKNDSLAIKWYRISAEQGHCKAQFQLGDIYEQGSCGVEKSREEALKWYELAAVQKGSEAKEAKRRLLIIIRDKYRKHN